MLLEGVPGLGKTLLVRTLSAAFSLEFRRIQFTPDLMPADIAGTNIVMEDQASGRREFQFQHGPIFAQIILADEINRATPKTQSAMLEAMQEHSVTGGGQVRKLAEPFLVLATQNPIEQEGTYPLPEAQLDRFFFKLLVGYSNREELKAILDRTTTGDEPQAQPVADAAEDPLGPEAGPAGRGRRARAGLRDPAGPGDASAGRIRDGDDEPVRPVRLLAARRAGPGPGGQGPRHAR